MNRKKHKGENKRKVKECKPHDEQQEIHSAVSSGNNSELADYTALLANCFSILLREKEGV